MNMSNSNGGDDGDANELGGRSLMSGDVSANDHRNVTQWMLNDTSCNIPAQFPLCHQIFAFFLPLSALRPNAVTFTDVRDPDVNPWYTMFTLYLRFAQVLMNVCDVRNQQLAAGAPPPSNVPLPTVGTRRNARQMDDLSRAILGDGMSAPATPTNDGNGRRGGGGNVPVRQRTRNTLSATAADQALAQLIANDLPPDTSDASSSSSERRSCEMLVETLVHESEFTTLQRDRATIKDRCVVGYRFWLLHYNKSVDGNVVFARILQHVNTIQTLIANRQVTAKAAAALCAPHRRYMMVDSVVKLRTFFNSIYGTAIPSSPQSDDFQFIASYRHFLCATNIFNAHWLPMIKPLDSTYSEQRKSYYTMRSPSDGIEFRIVADNVRKVFLRVMRNDILQEGALQTRMLPHVQLARLTHVSNMLPAFFQQLNGLMNSSGGDEAAAATFNMTTEEDMLQADLVSTVVNTSNAWATDGVARMSLTEVLERLNKVRQRNDDHGTLYTEMLDLTIDRYEQLNELQRAPSTTDRARDQFDAVDINASVAENLKHIANSYNQTTKNVTQVSMRENVGLNAIAQNAMSPYVVLGAEYKRNIAAITRYVQTAPELAELPLDERNTVTRSLEVLLQARSMEEYQVSCMSNLSPTGAQLVDYTKASRLFEQPPQAIDKTSLDLTPYQHFLTTVALLFETDYQVVSKHGLALLMFLNTLDAFRLDYNSVHQHMLNYSNRGGDSKSFLQWLMHMCLLVPESSQILTFQSLKSRAIDGNLNDSIIFFDEVPACMITGDTSSFGGSANPMQDAARMTKSLMSLNVVVAEIMAITQNGQRLMRRVHCNAISVFIFNTNIDPSLISSSMKRRVLPTSCEESAQPSRTVMDVHASSVLCGEKDAAMMQNKSNRMFRFIQVMVFHVEKMIHVGALPPVSTDACEIILLRLSNELTRLHYPEPNPSMYERIRVAARAHCIVDAIVSTFLMRGARFADTPVHLAQLRELSPRLWINAQHVVKAISDHWTLLIDSIEVQVKKALVYIHEQHVSKNRTKITQVYKYAGGDVSTGPRVDPTYLSFLNNRAEEGAINNNRPSLSSSSDRNNDGKPKSTNVFAALTAGIISTLSTLEPTVAPPSSSAITSVLQRWFNTNVNGHQYSLMELNTTTSVPSNQASVPTPDQLADQSVQAVTAQRNNNNYGNNRNKHNRRNGTHVRAMTNPIPPPPSSSSSSTSATTNNSLTASAIGVVANVSDVDDAFQTRLVAAPVAAAGTTLSTANDGALERVAYHMNAWNQFCLVRSSTHKSVQRAVIVNSYGIYIHRDQVCTTDITDCESSVPTVAKQTKHVHRVPDPRQQILSIISDIFSMKHQMPQTFVFDNHAQIPKWYNFIHCQGPKEDEDAVLAFDPALKTDTIDNRILGRAAKERATTGSAGDSERPAVIIRDDLDSYCMHRHQDRMHVSASPVSRRVFNIVRLLEDKLLPRAAQPPPPFVGDPDQTLPPDMPMLEPIPDNGFDRLVNAGTFEEMIQMADRREVIDVNADNVYDEQRSGGGYFMGLPLNRLFNTRSASVSQESLAAVCSILIDINRSASNNDDPLKADADFCASHYWVRRHPDPNAPPEFHQYAWDVIAEKHYRSNNNVRSADPNDFVYVPPMAPEISLRDLSPLRLQQVIDDRRDSFRHNIPLYKMIYTHPMVSTEFFNLRRDGMGLRDDDQPPIEYIKELTQNLEQALVNKTRAARWETRRTYKDTAVATSNIAPSKRGSINVRSLFKDTAVRIGTPLLQRAQNMNNNNNNNNNNNVHRAGTVIVDESTSDVAFINANVIDRALSIDNMSTTQSVRDDSGIGAIQNNSN